MKRLAVILAILMLSLLLCACGGGDETPSSEPSGGDGTYSSNLDITDKEDTSSSGSPSSVISPSSDKPVSSNGNQSSNSSKEPVSSEDNPPAEETSFECDFCGKEKTEIGLERDVKGELIRICKECIDTYGNQIEALLGQIK